MYCSVTTLLIHYPNLGTLESGKIADVILIDGNPIKKIADLQKVKIVIKEGKVVVKK